MVHERLHVMVAHELCDGIHQAYKVLRLTLGAVVGELRDFLVMVACH